MGRVEKWKDGGGGLWPIFVHGIAKKAAAAHKMPQSDMARRITWYG